jgi:hypothetical protein
MSMLIEPQPRKPHRCNPPGTLGCVTNGSEDQLRREDYRGALWRCDCGRFWEGTYMGWTPISDRRARKLLRS